MPLKRKESQKALITADACQQGVPINEPSPPDMHIASYKTMPVCHNGQVPDSLDRQLGHDRDNDVAIKRPSVVPSLYNDTSSQVTTLAASDGDQGHQPTVATTQEVNTAANILPLSCYPPHEVAPDTTDGSSKTENESHQTQGDVQIVNTSVIAEKTHVNIDIDHGKSSQSVQHHSNTTIQVLMTEPDGSTPGHRQDSAQVLDWRNTTNSQKCLQSLHSLRKMWAEWETKYRPPPVSI